MEILSYFIKLGNFNFIQKDIKSKKIGFRLINDKIT